MPEAFTAKKRRKDPKRGRLACILLKHLGLFIFNGQNTLFLKQLHYLGSTTRMSITDNVGKNSIAIATHVSTCQQKSSLAYEKDMGLMICYLTAKMALTEGDAKTSPQMAAVNIPSPTYPA
jgi:hypothetical protein